MIIIIRDILSQNIMTVFVTIVGVFAENLVGIGFLYSVSYIKSIPTHEKLFAVGKSGPNAPFNLIFLGVGSSWVGGFVGFIIFTRFPSHGIW